MRIALVILHADAARGGAERYTVDLARQLRQRGHEVSLLASSFAGDDGGAERVLVEARGWTRLGRYRRFLSSLDAHLAKSPYDIVHAMLPVRRCDVYHPHAGIAAEAMTSGHLKHAGPLRQALAHLDTRLNLRRRAFAAVERELLTGAKPPVVLCLSQYVRQSLLWHYTVDQAHMAMLMNGVDLSRFAPAADAGAQASARQQLGLPRNQTIALLVAQDFARKGLSEAIGALAMAQDTSLALVVVGKDKSPPYQRLASDLGVSDRVIFAGGTSDIRPYYQAADFFVLPTRHDPCSLVVLEALAMGLPVISTRQNGACEVMTDGQEGMVLSDPGDVTALAAAMRTILDGAKRAQMRGACLKLRPSLSQESHVARLLAVYERLPAATA